MILEVRPAIMTTIGARGGQRMAKNGAIIRKFAAVEDFGAAISVTMHR